MLAVIQLFTRRHLCAPQLLSFWAHNPGIDATCAFTLHTLTATRSLFGTIPPFPTNIGKWLGKLVGIRQNSEVVKEI